MSRPMSALKDQIVLVTGSSRGLGLAIARAFRREGARVIINYLRSDALAEQAAHELNAIAIQADVTSLEDTRTMFASAAKHYGQPVSVVVNNALADFTFNGDARKDLPTIEWADYDKQMQGAVRGTLNTTKAALEGFERLGRGRIINIGSNLVQNPVVPYHDYNAAKGALVAFTHSIAAELGPKQITCNLVSGGLLNVTDASKSTPERVFEQVRAITPLRKVTTPEDMAGAVLYFASPWADAVTGQQIVVDGGLVMT